MYAQVPDHARCHGASCSPAHAGYSFDRAMQYYAAPSDSLHADPSSTARPEVHPSARVQHCLRELDTADSGAPKAGLVIVVTVSPDRISDAELGHATDNIRRYAEKWGYSFHIETAQATTLFHFMNARWLALITSPVWQRHEWILHLDGDSIIVGFNKSLEAFTASSEHMYMQIRENKEVTGAVQLMRTTPFSECFLRYWNSKGLIWEDNMDNGDLLAALLDFAAPDLAESCNPLRLHHEYDAYIGCFSQAHARLLSLQRYMPITFMAPLAGFWKSLEGLHDPGFQERSPTMFKLLMRCWSSDFIAHGSKTIGTWAWWARPDQNALAPHCVYNTPEEELQLARDCCLWHFPGMQQCYYSLHHWTNDQAVDWGGGGGGGGGGGVACEDILSEKVLAQAAWLESGMCAERSLVARARLAPSCSAAAEGAHEGRRSLAQPEGRLLAAATLMPEATGWYHCGSSRQPHEPGPLPQLRLVPRLTLCHAKGLPQQLSTS